ncbi:hypothetical protein [Halomarina rubra]|uniref:Uncharacterized protein n=1 Tax=Halomarina rubra TaxID=2071873 RepID=A0ABD6B0B3_9EURY|nr:hypothetical protein [Halomarina rubra]
MSRKPLHGDDYVFDDPPAWLPTPLQKVAGDLIYDEAHALELGLVGIPLGIALTLGYDRLAIGTLIALITIAFGLRAAPNSLPIASRTVQKEPWYFLIVLIGSMTLAAGAVAMVH